MLLFGLVRVLTKVRVQFSLGSLQSSQYWVRLLCLLCRVRLDLLLDRFDNVVNNDVFSNQWSKTWPWPRSNSPVQLWLFLLVSDGKWLWYVSVYFKNIVIYSVYVQWLLIISSAIFRSTQYVRPSVRTYVRPSVQKNVFPIPIKFGM